MHPASLPVFLAAFGRLASAAASNGCGKNSTAPVLETRATVELAVNTSRSFMYWLPPKYDPNTPAPVILSYGGIRQSPTKQANLDQFGNTLFNDYMIAVWPAAVEQTDRHETMWQGPRTATADDIGFTMDVLDQLEEDFCIDTDRIYASGKSEGAGFTGLLACNSTSNSRIAAFAPVSGAFYPGNNDGSSTGCKTPITVPCSPMRCKIPFLEFHGGDDWLVPIDGGEERHECLPDIRTYVSQWAQRNQLPSEPVSSYNLTSAGEVFLYDENATVIFVYDGDTIGHDWPWTCVNPDTVRAHSQPASFNATTFIMDWFANHTLAAPDNCNATVS